VLEMPARKGQAVAAVCAIPSDYAQGSRLLGFLDSRLFRETVAPSQLWNRGSIVMEDVVVTLKLPYRLAPRPGFGLASLRVRSRAANRNLRSRSRRVGESEDRGRRRAKIAGTPSLNGLTISVACEKGRRRKSPA